MATPRATSNRSLVSWLFIAAGVLLLLEILFSYIAPAADRWLLFFGYLALGVALLMLFLQKSKSLLLRYAYIVATVGWIVFAIANVVNLGAVVDTIVLVLALVGTLGAGILGYLGHVFTRYADLAFLIGSILAALELLDALFLFAPGIFEVITGGLFAVALIVTGVYSRRRR
jgi:hypothetical protein